MKKAKPKAQSYITGWGSNTHSQLSFPCDAGILLPTMLSFDSIFAISSGQFHTLILTDNLELLSYGGNINGQLGNGVLPKITPKLNPIKSLEHKKFESIYCSGSSSFALTTSGTAYSWGLNVSGQLGIGGYKDAFIPQQIILPSAKLSSNNISMEETRARNKEKFSLKNNIHAGSKDETASQVSQRSLSVTKKGSKLNATMDSECNILKSINDTKITQLACGGMHTLLLTCID